METRTRSLCHHHLGKLLVIDLSITIDIGLTNHFINFFISQLLAQIRHHVPQFSSRDETILVLVKNPESFLELLFGVRVFHLPGHKVQELWEVDGAITISIDFVYHVLKFSLGRVLA
ncbi:hypothetical protein AKJ16_DCAP09418 [Drosera capensis]